jgi:hypothetical protein
VWRVGNGAQIRIWQDKWLPYSVRPLDLYPRGEFTEEARVEVLIDWDTKRWKLDLIYELFGEATAADICQIPIGSVHNCNKEIWQPTFVKNWVFLTLSLRVMPSKWCRH